MGSPYSSSSEGESSSSSSGEDRRDGRKERRKKEKERKYKKEKKEKKEKKDRKEKKLKKEKKKRERQKTQKKEKKEKRREFEFIGTSSSYSTEEQREIDEFKRSVQGSLSSIQKRTQSAKVLGSLGQSLELRSKEELARAFGLSTGIIRSAEQSYDEVRRRAADCDDLNPAKRQRMMRELNAQKAIEKARAVMAARNKEMEGQTTDKEGFKEDFITRKFTVES